jgi:hypothetical protein
MMTATYTPLANVTLASTASSIVFNSIPNTYKDLVIVFLGRATSTVQAGMRFNGDTSGSNYSSTRISGNGSTASTANTTDTYIRLSRFALGATTSGVQFNINIMDYSATDKHKTVLSRADNAAYAAEAIVNRWASTAAINSVRILTDANSWAVGTTVALYGIVA